MDGYAVFGGGAPCTVDLRLSLKRVSRRQQRTRQHSLRCGSRASMQTDRQTVRWQCEEQRGRQCSSNTSNNITMTVGETSSEGGVLVLRAPPWSFVLYDGLSSSWPKAANSIFSAGSRVRQLFHHPTPHVAESQAVVKKAGVCALTPASSIVSECLSRHANPSSSRGLLGSLYSAAPFSRPGVLQNAGRPDITVSVALQTF